MSKKSITTSTNLLKNQLLTLVSQEMLTPLTSVMGMASILNQEIYGPLKEKQKEYVEIINERSKYLRSLVEQMIALTRLDESCQNLESIPVDVKNLCQQIVKDLEAEMGCRQVKLKLLAGGSDHKILFFNKEFLRQILYNLIYSIIQSAGSGSEIKLHLSKKEEKFNVAVWVSHPILGDYLPHSHLYSQKLSTIEENNNSSLTLHKLQLTFAQLKKIIFDQQLKQEGDFTTNPSRDLLALLFSCQLAEKQGGSLWIHGSAQSGYRYILVLLHKTYVI